LAFLASIVPDIAGVIEGQVFLSPLAIAEVKAKSLTLEHVYQAKRYKDVLQARCGFLVTDRPIPEELKRLCDKNWDILNSVSDSVYKFLAIGQFDIAAGTFNDWFPEDPFQQARFWEF
jgi:hypothetical protein